MPTCLLVRHGRTAANATGMLAGWTPGVALDERGREQVAGLAVRLRDLPVRALFTSPLQRCRETSDILVADAWPTLTPETVEDLGECRYGAWTGRPLAELAKEDLWRVVQDTPSAARFPDGDDFPGESIRDMAARGVAAIRAADARVAEAFGPDALWVAVSHGDVVKAILADAAGAPLDEFQRFVVGPASVSAVRHAGERTFLLRANDTGADLGALLPPPPKADDTTDDDAAANDAAVGGGA